ncbi:MAG: ROK family protein [Actinomycetia bacterium]|nr:ROK family protein [Actinomycetes bacterium]
MVDRSTIPYSRRINNTSNSGAHPGQDSVDDSRVIGIDIGGTRSKVGIVDASGTILRYDSMETPFDKDPQQFLRDLRALVERFGTEEIQGVGLSLPGILTGDSRSIEFNPNTPFLEQVDFDRWLRQFGVPHAIEQDLNAAALGEYVFGVGSGSPRFLAVSIGTGLGAGVVLDGELLRFTGGTVGDSGHIILDPSGPRCASGCAGCAEAYVGVSALNRMAKEIAKTSGAIDVIDHDDPAAGLIAASARGEPRSMAAVDAVGTRLGQWLASIAPMFLPDRVALCGGVAEAGETLLLACRRSFSELSGAPYRDCEILLGGLGSRAGVVGAAVPLLLNVQPA